jgi:hypothetical protein
MSSIISRKKNPRSFLIAEDEAQKGAGAPDPAGTNES